MLQFPGTMCPNVTQHSACIIVKGGRALLPLNDELHCSRKCRVASICLHSPSRHLQMLAALVAPKLLKFIFKVIFRCAFCSRVCAAAPDNVAWTHQHYSLTTTAAVVVVVAGAVVNAFVNLIVLFLLSLLWLVSMVMMLPVCLPQLLVRWCCWWW